MGRPSFVRRLCPHPQLPRHATRGRCAPPRVLPGQRRAQRRRALAALRCGRDGRSGLVPDLPQPLSPHTAISVPPALWRSLSDLSQRSSRCARPPSHLPYLYCACAQVEALRQPPLPTQLETWQYGQSRRRGRGSKRGVTGPTTLVAAALAVAAVATGPSANRHPPVAGGPRWQHRRNACHPVLPTVRTSWSGAWRPSDAGCSGRGS